MILSVFNLIFKFNKWRVYPNCPAEAHNCIMVAAPHTSNWDFVYSMVALKKLGLNTRFTIKKEFNKPLIGSWIRSLGALWIDRSPRKGSTERPSMTEVMFDLFNKSEEKMAVLVTPEGTRSKVTKWKTGFYYTALEAKVPICLADMDYKNKITGVVQCFMPSGNIEQDMKIIMDFYRGRNGKFPENFALDQRYA